MHGVTERDLRALSNRLGELLQATGGRLAAAESCTGGWLAKVVTDVAGSSAWFDRGFVTYSNAAKQAMLGVPEALLAEHGAVSGPVVRAMALGALRHSEAEHAVAISGVAGPGGGSADKPVGTVWFGWAGPAGATCERRLFAGDREQVRREAVAAALEGVIASLQR